MFAPPSSVLPVFSLLLLVSYSQSSRQILTLFVFLSLNVLSAVFLVFYLHYFVDFLILLLLRWVFFSLSDCFLMYGHCLLCEFNIWILDFTLPLCVSLFFMACTTFENQMLCLQFSYTGLNPLRWWVKITWNTGHFGGSLTRQTIL